MAECASNGRRNTLRHEPNGSKLPRSSRFCGPADTSPHPAIIFDRNPQATLHKFITTPLLLMRPTAPPAGQRFRRFAEVSSHVYEQVHHSD
jgi:hypothetical protein